MTTPPEPLVASGRHPINVGHLVMGIAFLGLVGVWAVIEADWIGDDDLRWLFPVPWVLAGLAGLLAVALGGRHRQPATDQPVTDQAAAYSYPAAEDETTVIPTEDDTTVLRTADRTDHRTDEEQDR